MIATDELTKWDVNYAVAEDVESALDVIHREDKWLFSALHLLKKTVGDWSASSRKARHCKQCRILLMANPEGLGKLGTMATCGSRYGGGRFGYCNLGKWCANCNVHNTCKSCERIIDGLKTGHKASLLTIALVDPLPLQADSDLTNEMDRVVKIFFDSLKELKDQRLIRGAESSFEVKITDVVDGMVRPHIHAVVNSKSLTSKNMRDLEKKIAAALNKVLGYAQQLHNSTPIEVTASVEPLKTLKDIYRVLSYIRKPFDIVTPYEKAIADGYRLEIVNLKTRDIVEGLSCAFLRVRTKCRIGVYHGSSREFVGKNVRKKPKMGGAKKKILNARKCGRSRVKAR